MTNEIKAVVGIDIGMDRHQCQVSAKDGSVLLKEPLPNTRKAARNLSKRLESIAGKDEILIGLEATNNYHLCLEKYLISNGYKVVTINPLKTSAYKQIDDYGNKTDPIDANGICQFLLDGKHKKVKRMNQKYLKLRELCRCWMKFQSDLTRTAIRLHSRMIIINPEFKSYFSEPFCDSGLYILDSFMLPENISRADIEKLQAELDKIANGFGKKDTAKRIVELAKNSFGVKDNIEGYVRYIQYHIEEYKFLKKKVFEIKREIRRETRKSYCSHEIELTSSIRGIGTEIAAGILSELGDINNFEKISSIVRFAGLITLRNSSGKTEGKSRMSKQGSKYLRCYLYQAAMGAKLHSAAFAAVYANRNMKVKELDPQSKRIAKAKILSNIARRILENIALCLMKDRMFNDKIAFDNIEIDDFIRETIAVQFKKQLAEAACKL